MLSGNGGLLRWLLLTPLFPTQGAGRGAMGHPVAPLPLLLLLLHPVTPTTPAAPCFPALPTASAELDLANSSRQCAELDWGPFQQKSRLWLSHNGIGALSPSSRIGPELLELDLSHNRLQELPPAFLSRARHLRHLQLQHNQLRQLPAGFFANATALQILRLEGNPLPAVPPTAFQASLQLLAVPCRCDVVGTILAPCTCSGCAAPQCHCLTAHHNFVNVTDFHHQQCRHNVGLVAGLAGAAAGVAVLVLGTAAVCYWRRKAATGAASVGWGKWEPAGAHGQPRYISRAMETGTTDATAALDYENVFVNPCTVPAAAPGWMPGWQEEQHSPQVLEDDDYFLESEASPRDQPIYANTQSASEDIYIVPDK
ncbi:leucine-rich repeat-containing protein 25-like isoform X2 [Falco cherrug]|uniref:leucine-rich repeat-containing protein 25-like isoform X2 n=2 Tax=Falco cherrug TaxID=345164 RepID=UPI00247A1DE7|nr:leucine-rich repeat-containing protein 25-like isoform X2 [Falco cherrug]